MADDKTKRLLKIETNRFKGLLNDIRYYNSELESFTKTEDKYKQIADADEKAAKLKYLQNQVDETKNAINTCVTRTRVAQEALYTQLQRYPKESIADKEFQDGLAMLERSKEVDLAYDVDFVKQYKK